MNFNLLTFVVIVIMSHILAIRRDTLFQVSYDVRKDGNVLMTQQSDTALSCAILCNEIPRCKSANFGRDETNGDLTCEIMDAESGTLRRGDFWQYMNTFPDDCEFYYSDEQKNSCYRTFHYMPTDYYTAQEVCASTEFPGYLANLETDDEARYVHGALQTLAVSVYWMIGLKGYGNEWQWSNSGDVVSFGVAHECIADHLEIGALYVDFTSPLYYDICRMHFFVCEYEI